MPREIALMWIPMGLEPLSSNVNGLHPMPSLHAAAKAALDGMDGKSEEKFLPWIRAGTGTGAAILNIQGIKLIWEAYQEGVNAGQ